MEIEEGGVIFKIVAICQDDGFGYCPSIDM